MGFDVVYLTPIHPIGQTATARARTTPSTPRPSDPGSPYAIGSADGGHDAIHPDLGTFDDFDAFVAEARRLGLEVALDLALQCSPDHPWVETHPEWFTTRADGTIAYAENPPKKYQDIYPLNFDNDPAGIYAEVRRVVQVWIDHGVTLFRVDNPHTKPVEFWQWLIADVAQGPPRGDLAGRGLHQARDDAHPGQGRLPAVATPTTPGATARSELREYVTELSGDAAAYMRPSFWPTTHDILTPYMQYGGPAAWKLRAVLAATLVPTYGIYAGYELMEHVAAARARRSRSTTRSTSTRTGTGRTTSPAAPKAGRSLSGYLTMHQRDPPRAPGAAPAARHPRSTTSTTRTSSSSPSAAGCPTARDDVVLVVANLDPHSTRATTLRLDMAALGLEPSDDLRGPRPRHRPDAGPGSATSTCGSARRSNPSTSSP